jgi:hypothetical protein
MRLAVVACLFALTLAAHGSEDPRFGSGADLQVRQPPQQGRPGVADRATPASPRGTARIRGRVVALDTGRPLRRASVTAVSDTGIRRSAMTDEEGIFDWRNLPAGRYRLHAGRDGYVALDFGEDPAEGGGRSITLTDDKAFFDRADFRLPHAGAIVGQIVDESGDPIEGVQVSVMTLEYMAGTARLVPVGAPVLAKPTNDLGRYRIFGLQPGEYFVVARPGAFNSAAPPNGDMAVGYILTYYPGSAEPADAQLVTVVAAQETQADFRLAASRTFDLSGVARDSAGNPVVSARVVLNPGTNASISLGVENTTSGDGSFAFSGLAPGPYLLTLQPLPEPPPGTFTFGPSRVFASLVVNVSPNMPEVLLQGRQGRTVRGQVTTDGGQQVDLRTVAITTRPVDFAASPLDPRQPVAVRANGTFDLLDVWGTQVIEVLPPSGWALKAVRLGGLDATDRPIDFDREIGTLQVVVTAQVSEISGTVTDEGHAAANVPVIVFPANRERWDFQSRFVRLVNADENGLFTCSPMPPGDYRSIALPRLRSGTRWQRPQFLESLVPDSTRVTVREGEHANVELRVVSRPR